MPEIFSRGFVLLLLCTIFLAGNTDSLSEYATYNKICMQCLEEMIDVKDSVDGNKNDITWFKKIMQRHPKVRGSGNVRPLSQQGNR